MQDPHRGVAGHGLPQTRDQAAVELDRQDLGCPRIHQRGGERSEPGPDLHDPVPGADAGVTSDRAREVGVEQEVLTESLGRTDAVAGSQLADIDVHQHTVAGPREPSRCGSG